ncbi:MAG: hypothetical protein WA102_05190 [Candidatus Methanoperedens sp.]
MDTLSGSVKRKIGMPDDLKKFNDKLKKVNDKARTDIETNFSNLIEIAKQLDPVKLLSQLNLTFLFVPKDKFIEESSDTVKWARWIEFFAGYLLAHEYPKNAKINVDGEDLEKIEKLLDEYLLSISVFLSTSMSADETNKETEMVINSAKIYSLYVRGESYPHQLREVAKNIYSQHDDWFIKKLGFTIADAVSISESITNEYNRRINEEKHSCLERAKEYVNELISKGEANEENRKELEARVGIYYYFGNSDSILSFSLDELVRFCGLSKEKCEKYLERLSQKFGYRNASFPNAFSDPYTAPWDYNTLYERPIVLHNDKYFVPIPSLFNEVLLHTFYYDLIDDYEYWKSEGEKKYGSWLEQKTAEFLNRVFPKSEVLLNPKYPNGEELCDVLVLHDRNILIVQCKTKRLRYDSKIGKDIHSIKEDLTMGVKESFEQAKKARDYLFNTQFPKIRELDSRLLVDSKQISNIFLMSVTLGSYQDLTTRLANINTTLNLFSDNQYPWAISLFDLGVVTELIEYPSMFIHYARRRLTVERTNFDLVAGEIDLLGFYFSQGLFFETEDFKKINAASLSGFSDEIDQYIFEKHECGKNPQKPKQKMPVEFEEYLKVIEKLESSYKTDCVVRLLDLSYQSRELFVSATEQTKEKSKNDGGIHSCFMVLNNNVLGFSFISMDANNDLEKLFRQVFSYAAIKKYTTKCKEWVGLGWDKNSKEVLDVAVFLSFDWQEDHELAKIAKEKVKREQIVSFEKLKDYYEKK